MLTRLGWLLTLCFLLFFFICWVLDYDKGMLVFILKVSTKRLSEFLSYPEVGSDVPWRKKEEMPEATVEFHPESGSVFVSGLVQTIFICVHCYI